MKIAAQMYSVHDTAAKGYADALKQVAKIGFQAVELAAGCGYAEFDGKPVDLKKCLDDLGITAIGAHVSTESVIDPEERKKMIEFYSILNARFMICPYDGRFMDPAANAKFADDFNQAAEELKKAGMYCGYHNH